MAPLLCTLLAHICIMFPNAIGMYCQFNASARPTSGMLSPHCLMNLTSMSLLFVFLPHFYVNPFKMGKLIFSALLLTLPSVISAQQYELVKTYGVQNFFDDFSFFTVCRYLLTEIRQILTFNRDKILQAGSLNMSHSK